jgi:hypothetical protein
MYSVNLIGGDAELPHLMVGMFFIGAICPAYALAQSLGLTQTADILSQEDGLPATGLQAMHMAYQICMSRTCPACLIALHPHTSHHLSHGYALVP